MPLLVPTATYESPSESQTVNFVPGDGPHSTDGKTTQISDIVIEAGGEDRDKPSEARNTDLGALRAQLTTKLDDDAEADVEKRLLDDGVDEDSD
ncbi:hypothetical protein OXX59_009293 [Metschnikowia pulcherrima]